MPFTPSHVAAVLPVLGLRSERVVPVAWVVGSMAPDYPWFLTAGRGATMTHSAVGVLTVDLVVGVLGVLLWRFVLLAPLRDLLPPTLGLRLPARTGLTRPEWPWVVVGVVGGAVTHVVWDSFTHAGRWGVRWIGFLHSQAGPLPGYKWAQYGSGLLGGLLVAVALLLAARRTQPGAAGPPGVSVGQRFAAFAGIGVLVLLVVAVVAVDRWDERLEVLLFGVVTRGGAAAGAGVLLACGAWWVGHARSASARR